MPSKLKGMTKRVARSPELTRALVHARKVARTNAELATARLGASESTLSETVRVAIADGRVSGDYDRIVAEVVAADPDLATQ